MDEGADGDRLYLELILELIDAIQSDLEPMERDTFLADRNLSDLTAYRLSTIGEYTQRLSAALRQRQPEVPWQAIYRMRNIIAHHYYRVKKERVWAVVQNDLETLAAVCREEIERLEP